MRDQHTGCVGAYLVEHDLFDFLLFSLPDNDAFSHRNGPHAPGRLDRRRRPQLERLMHAAGGLDVFLEEHAVIVLADHSQAPVEERDPPLDGVRGLEGLGQPAAPDGGGRDRAQPGAALGDGLRARRGAPRPPLPRGAQAARDGAGRGPGDVERGAGEAAIAARRGELRFAPGGDLVDLVAGRWSVDGDLAALEPRSRTAAAHADYPDALGRCGPR